MHCKSDLQAQASNISGVVHRDENCISGLLENTKSHTNTYGAGFRTLRVPVRNKMLIAPLKPLLGLSVYQAQIQFWDESKCA